MKIASVVVGILGGAWCTLLAMKWQGDAQKHRELIEAAQTVGADMSELSSLMTASWMMVPGVVVGIVAGVMAMRGRGKLAGAVLVLFSVAPMVFTFKAFAGTVLLLVAGFLAGLSSRRPAAPPVHG